MVGQGPLKPLILVRIQAREPIEYKFKSASSVDHRAADFSRLTATSKPACMGFQPAHQPQDAGAWLGNGKPVCMAKAAVVRLGGATG
jgi:hypothetical protein